MEDVTRKRILRKLEQLPEDRLYQVLDYIEFLELKYARATSRKPDAFQQFAERVEDQMRVRSVAPKAMKGTMRVMSTAGKVLDGVRSLGRDLVTPPDRTEVSVRRPGGEGSGTGSGARRGGVAEEAQGGSVEPDGSK
ncbi:MAG: DUF2281 domain-containing protein [Longimicrobiales bacterium]|nr:DUF2281 domain-containing protein [Longimicrobiales bacterium]